MIYGNWIKKWGQALFSLTIVIALGMYLWEHRDNFCGPLSLSFGQLTIIVLLILLNWVANSMPMLIFARLAGKEIGFWANFFVQAGAMLGNYLPMRLGTIVRMRYFKRVIGMDYSAFIGIMVVRSILLALSSSLFGCLGLLGLTLKGYSLPPAIYALFGGILVASVVALILPVHRISVRNRFLQVKLAKLTEAHRTMRRAPRTFFIVMGCTVFQQLCFSARLYIAFAAFKVVAPLWFYFIVGPASSVLTFFTISVGNLGLREWIIGMLSSVSGYDFQVGFFASTLDRGVMLALTFTLGGAGILYALHTTSKTPGLLRKPQAPVTNDHPRCDGERAGGTRGPLAVK